MHSTHFRHLGRVRFYVSEVIRKEERERERERERECNFSFFDKKKKGKVT